MDLEVKESPHISAAQCKVVERVLIGRKAISPISCSHLVGSQRPHKGGHHGGMLSISSFSITKAVA